VWTRFSWLKIGTGGGLCQHGDETSISIKGVSISSASRESLCSKELAETEFQFSRLGGAVVSVLATRPKGRGFKSDRGDGFLRAIKIRSTPSFGWEVKPEAPCRKILLHVQDLLRYLRH
jgi:hypothetical protein